MLITTAKTYQVCKCVAGSGTQFSEPFQNFLLWGKFGEMKSPCWLKKRNLAGFQNN